MTGVICHVRFDRRNRYFRTFKRGAAHDRMPAVDFHILSCGKKFEKHQIEPCGRHRFYSRILAFRSIAAAWPLWRRTRIFRFACRRPQTFYRSASPDFKRRFQYAHTVQRCRLCMEDRHEPRRGRQGRGLCRSYGTGCRKCGRYAG